MLSLDITYYMAYVVLWGIGETTIGFLIIGIPSLPTAANVMPFSNAMTSLLRSFGRQSETLAHQGNRSWHKSLPLKPRRDQWQITDLDTYDLITVTTSKPGSGVATHV
jgi:hypothetical protein